MLSVTVRETNGGRNHGARMIKSTVEEFVEDAPASKKTRAAQADDGADNEAMDDLADVEFEDDEDEDERPRRRRKS